MGVQGMTSDPAVVLFSGGQDSTTCLAQAIHERGADAVRCITFRYGQRHDREVEVACGIATDLKVAEHRVVALEGYGQLTRSALLDCSIDLEQPPGDSVPNTLVDGRNMLFLLLAAIYAKGLGVRTLIAGVCQTDFSGYPDCRDVFVKSCNVTLNLAMDYDFRILTPLMHLTKADTWALAERLGVLPLVAKRTLTCYRGILGPGCGECPSCRLRRRGYETFRAARGASEC